MTVHCGVQAPFLVPSGGGAGAAAAPNRASASWPMTAGGAYGGKQRGECEIEAARVSRLSGTPVRVAWTREEEFTCSYTRPAGLVEVESGVDAGRTPAGDCASPTTTAARPDSRPQYDIPHHWIGFYPDRHGGPPGQLPVAGRRGQQLRARGARRRVGRRRCSVDPVAFRLRHITDARLREVIARTTRRFGWDAARVATCRAHGRHTGGAVGASG